MTISLKKDKWETLPEMFFKEAQIQLNKPLLWYKKKDDKYHSYSWNEVKNKINLLRFKLQKIGLKKGDRVIIASENNPNWFITDFAIMASGGVTVPAYTTYTKKDYQYLIKDCQAKILFISNEQILLNILPAIKNNKKIKSIFSYKNINQIIDKRIINLESIWNEKVEKRSNKLNIFEDDPACIIYTSGTSGVPKV